MWKNVHSPNVGGKTPSIVVFKLFKFCDVYTSEVHVIVYSYKYRMYKIMVDKEFSFTKYGSIFFK